MTTVALTFWIVVIDFGAYIPYKYSVLGAKKILDLDAIQNFYCSSECCVNPDLGWVFATKEQNKPWLIRVNTSS